MDDRRKGDMAGVARVSDLETLEAAADAFGGDLARWPARRRAEAEALLAREGAAGDAAAGRRILARAARLDAMLADAAAREPQVSPDFMRRLIADAEREAPPSYWVRLHRDVESVLRRLADRLGERISPDRGLTVSTGDFGFGALGGFGAAAAAAGLVFGLFGPIDASTGAAADWSARGESAYFDAFESEDAFDLSVFVIDDEAGYGEESDG